MKPIFRTDLALVIFGVASLATGILIHAASHHADHDVWHLWSVAHCIVNVGLVVSVILHVKQHKGWFKNLFKKSSLQRKMPIFVTVASALTIGSGVYLLLFVRGEGSHAGLLHYWFGMIFGVLAILHFAKRSKIFCKGVCPQTKNKK